MKTIIVLQPMKQTIVCVLDLEEGDLVLVWKTFGELINEIVVNGEEDVRLGYYD